MKKTIKETPAIIAEMLNVRTWAIRIFCIPFSITMISLILLAETIANAGVSQYLVVALACYAAILLCPVQLATIATTYNESLEYDYRHAERYSNAPRQYLWTEVSEISKQMFKGSIMFLVVGSLAFPYIISGVASLAMEGLVHSLRFAIPKHQRPAFGFLLGRVAEAFVSIAMWLASKLPETGDEEGGLTTTLPNTVQSWLRGETHQFRTFAA